MTGKNAVKSDTQLQHDVLDELERESSLDASRIGVTATDGVVTLTGTTRVYPDKIEAERIAKSSAGVKAVANDIEIRLPESSERNDTDIATAALNALKRRISIPDRVKVTVRYGWVTLEGDVDCQFQRDAARDAVRFLVGVKGVTNSITLATRPKPKDVRAKIESAFTRQNRTASGECDFVSNRRVGDRSSG